MTPTFAGPPLVPPATALAKSLNSRPITYIESQGAGKRCVIHTVSGESYDDSTSLGVYEERLRNKRFYRIHKTCLVHLKYVQDIFPWSGSDFAVRVRGSNTELPIGRDRLKGLRASLHI